MTSASVLSMTSGASMLICSVLTTVRICSASSLRSVTATHRSSACAPPSTCVRAIAEDAVVVVGEQQTLDRARPLGVDALTDEQRRRLLTQVDGVHAARQPRIGVRRHALPRVAGADVLTSSRMCSGVDPQHPPTMLTPYSLHEARELGCHRAPARADSARVRRR